MSARPGPSGGYHASGIPTGIQYPLLFGHKNLTVTKQTQSPPLVTRFSGSPSFSRFSGKCAISLYAQVVHRSVRVVSACCL
jgi:hypothetical protein